MKSTDPKEHAMQTLAIDYTAISTEARVGRQLDALVGSANSRGKVILTTDLHGAKRYHETFELRKWENRDGQIIVSIQVKGFGGAKLYHVNVVTGFLLEARNAPADPLLRYAALAALRFAWTGTVPTPANGTVEVVEESVCGHCGAELTDPVSIERGVGPTCYGKSSGTKTITGRREFAGSAS